MLFLLKDFIFTFTISPGLQSLDSKITVEGILVSKGAKESIEKAGGKVVDANQKKEAKKTKEIDKGDES